MYPVGKAAAAGVNPWSASDPSNRDVSTARAASDQAPPADALPRPRVKIVKRGATCLVEVTPIQHAALELGLSINAALLVQTPIQYGALVIASTISGLPDLSTIAYVQHEVLSILPHITSLKLSEFVNGYQVEALLLGLSPEYALLVQSAPHYNALERSLVDKENLHLLKLHSLAADISEERDLHITRDHIRDITSIYQIRALETGVLTIAQALYIKTSIQYKALQIAIAQGLKERKRKPIDKLAQIENEFQLSAFREGASLQKAIAIKTQKDLDDWRRSLEKIEVPGPSDDPDDGDDASDDNNENGAGQIALERPSPSPLDGMLHLQDSSIHSFHVETPICTNLVQDIDPPTPPHLAGTASSIYYYNNPQNFTLTAQATDALAGPIEPAAPPSPPDFNITHLWEEVTAAGAFSPGADIFHHTS